MIIGEVEDVLMSEIELQGANVRSDSDSEYSKESLRELAESISINGLMQPIVLRGTFGNPKYDVLVGQRRFRAHKLLGKEKIKAVFAGDVSNTEALILSLSENLLRQEMNRADIGDAVTKLYKEFGNDEYAVRDKLGLSIRAIRDYIKIEDQATPEMKLMIREDKLSLADAKRVILAAQGNSDKANAMAATISEMTKYEKTRAVEFGRNNPEATAQEIVEKAKTPRFEESLIINLPLKVSKALKKAAQTLRLESEEIAMNALTDWLKLNEFLLIS